MDWKGGGEAPKLCFGIYSKLDPSLGHGLWGIIVAQREGMDSTWGPAQSFWIGRTLPKAAWGSTKEV